MLLEPLRKLFFSSSLYFKVKLSYIYLSFKILLVTNVLVFWLNRQEGLSLGGVIARLRNWKDCGYKTFTRLFETGVMSILNYGAEIWGYGNYPKCDTIMNRAMRYFVGVHRFAPTAGVVGDTGWLSLKYKRYIVMLRFWNRLIKMNDNALCDTQSAYFIQILTNPSYNLCFYSTNILPIYICLPKCSWPIL